MFNLIPHIIKQRILQDYRARRVIVILAGFVLLVCVLFVFISPSFGYLFFEEKNVIAEAEAIKKSDQFKKADEVLKAIKETNEELRVLSTEIRSAQPTPAIEQIIKAKNQFIHITEIQYKVVHATSSLVTIGGKADRRDALKKFVVDLEGVPGFLDVFLPVSNFAKDKDIDFTVSIKML